MDNKVIRILVVDDHILVRKGIVHIIEIQPDMQVVGEASNGKEAVALYNEVLPDVTLMDLRMPGMSGAETIEQIKNSHPLASVIIFTAYDTEEEIHRALRAGAMAFVTKEAPSDTLLNAIRLAACGQMSVAPTIAAKLIARLDRIDLTARETEVLTLIAQGKSNREIAGRCCITEGTVKSHVNTIFRKMKVTDRTQAALDAIKRGLVLLD